MRLLFNKQALCSATSSSQGSLPWETLFSGHCSETGFEALRRLDRPR